MAEARRVGVKGRLKLLLEAEGFQVDWLSPAQGYWRRADVCRWEGGGTARSRADLRDGMQVSFSSWDTMTACARYGIEVVPDGLATLFDVSAKKPLTKTT